MVSLAKLLPPDNKFDSPCQSVSGGASETKIQPKSDESDVILYHLCHLTPRQGWNDLLFTSWKMQSRSQSQKTRPRGVDFLKDPGRFADREPCDARDLIQSTMGG